MCGLSGNIQIAYENAVLACDDNKIGYSLEANKRTTIKLNADYNTYCDCSSFIAWALTQGGFYKSNPWFNTGGLPASVEKAGFKEVPLSGDWLPGDIVWYQAGFQGHKYGHTEMVHTGGNGKGITMGAHSARYPQARQVSINTYQSTASKYQKLFRSTDGSAVVTHWKQTNTYFNDEDMYNNAVCVYNYFAPLGFTKESISALLGNMQRESTLNPNLTEVGGSGYGLVQWTPGSIYKNWASKKGINLSDADENGNGQCDKLNEDAALDYSKPGGQWHSVSGYPEDWSAFSKLTDVEYATKVFLYNYLRAGVVAEDKRIEYAKRWYSEIDNFPSYIGDGGSVVGDMTTNAGIITDLIRRLVIPGHF